MLSVSVFVGAILAPDFAAAEAAVLGVTPAKAVWVPMAIRKAAASAIAFMFLFPSNCFREIRARIKAPKLFVNRAPIF